MSHFWMLCTIYILDVSLFCLFYTLIDFISYWYHWYNFAFFCTFRFHIWLILIEGLFLESRLLIVAIKKNAAPFDSIEKGIYELLLNTCLMESSLSGFDFWRLQSFGRWVWIVSAPGAGGRGLMIQGRWYHHLLGLGGGIIAVLYLEVGLSHRSSHLI